MKFLKKTIKNEAKLQRLFGLNFKQLGLLEKRIKPIWNRAEKQRLDRSNRQRAIGGGRPYTLRTIKGKIIAVLIYYKQYPTQELLGYMLGVDQSTISRLLNKMLPLIEEAADPALRSFLIQAKSEPKKRIGAFDDFLTKHPDLSDVSTDATEQSCFRSKKYDEQKKYYSGKAKQHTVKVQMSTASSGRILDISQTYPGSVHDKKIIDEEKTIGKFDKRIPHRFDSGYQGVTKQHPDYYLITPIKKPKGRELISLEKEYNKANSKRRVKAEHAFARAKKFRILASTFRQPLKVHNQTFRNIAALLNFRLTASIPVI